MTQSFEIIRTKSNNFPIIIVGKNYHGLGVFIGELAQLLKKRKFKGNVIFDLLLANGYKAKNRFMSSHFDGSEFHEPHTVGIDSINSKIVKKLEKFYFSNQEVLSNGILSKNEITIIKRTHKIVYKMND